MARGAQQEVEGNREGRGVEAVYRAETCEHAVSHALRDRHHEHSEACQHVLEEVPLRIEGSHDADERK